MSSATHTGTGAGSCEKYRHIFEQYDGWDVNLMVEICNHESGGNETATNWNDSHKGCNGSFGVLQTACLYANEFITIDDMYDPSTNIRIAHKIWQEQGYWAWMNSYKAILNK